MEESEGTEEPLTAEHLQQYFERYGWVYKEMEENIFRTAFQGVHDVFRVIVQLTEHWVIFRIHPFLDARQEGFDRSALQAMAMANHLVDMAKVGLDSQGDVFLSVELPTEGFCYSHFEDSMSTISQLADRLLLPLLQAQAIDEGNLSS